MQKFTIRINKAKFEYLPLIPILFENANTMIGVCHIKEDTTGMTGECRLEVDAAHLPHTYFVVYNFHTIEKVREFLTSITFKKEFDKAHSIQELLIE